LEFRCYLVEKVLHAGLRFLPIQGRVICCMHCLSLSKLGIPVVCRCMCMFIVVVGYPQTPEPVIPPGRLAQIDLSCVDVP